MWINRDPIANALVIFVHGFTGGPWKTWDEFPSLLQLQDNQTANSYDVYLFEYESKWLFQPSISYAVLKLRTFLKSITPRYDTIVLIAHSQGGLVAKVCLIDELLSGNGMDLKVDLVITCSTPHRGIFACNLPYMLSLIPILGRTIRCEQLCDLASWSPFIRKVKRHWGSPLIESAPCPSSPSTRYIRSITVAANEWLVRKDSALGFKVDTPDLSGGVRHGMTTEKLDRIFYGYLEGHGNPAKVLEEIGRIRFDPKRIDKFISEHVPAVSEILQPLHAPGQDLEGAARLMIQSFLARFPQRPLRSVTEVSEALEKYVQRTVSKVLS